LTVGSSTVPVGQYNCIATNRFAFVGVNPTNVVNPATFGVKMDGQMCRDSNAQFTTTTSVTCLTAAFTSADVGKAVFGTCCGLQGGVAHVASVLLLPRGTITAVNSATNVTVSIAGLATTCSAGAAGCLLIWGTLDDAAWDSTWTAATGTAGHCQPIQMGGGMTLISAAHFLTTTCNTGITGSGSQGASIVGWGYKASQFVIVPTFNAASCNGTGGGVTSGVCFGPGKGFQLINMGIWGGEYGNSAELSGKIFLDVGIDSYMMNTLLAGYGASGSGLIGIQFESSGQTMWSMIVDGFGASPSVNIIGGTYNVFVQSFVGDTSSNSINIANGTLFSYGGFYGQGTTSNATILMATGTTFKSYGDTCFNTTGGGGCLVTVAGATAYLDGDTITNTNTGTNFALFFNGGGVVHSRDTTYQGGSANHDIGQATMGTFFDEGGNTFVTGVAAGTIQPTCAESAGNGTCGDRRRVAGRIGNRFGKHSR